MRSTFILSATSSHSQSFLAAAVSALDMTSKTEDVATGQIRLPAHVSTPIVTALFGICEELHRVGSATVDHVSGYISIGY